MRYSRPVHPQVVHARGVGASQALPLSVTSANWSSAGAHGVFKLHTSLSDYTTANVLTEVGTETPVFVRFSTVLGQNGAAETAREVRGFATKFYTNQGVWVS